ncbi:MAG TPA: hypothetical protein DF383_10470, partial [Deltaproteobacteria bacterium]|nr:hypothetical protein [Deltaproteobacteria bacterium]
MKNKPAYPKSKLQKIWDAKSKRRKALAMLPFEKKIQILSELQKIAEPIERSKGKQVKVWKTAVEELAGAW